MSEESSSTESTESTESTAGSEGDNTADNAVENTEEKGSMNGSEKSDDQTVGEKDDVSANFEDKKEGEDGEGDKTEGAEEKFSPEFTKTMEEWAKVVDGEDKDLTKIVKRFGNDPVKLLKAYKDLRAQVSANEYTKNEAPKDDPEALAEWREKNNVPEKPEDYELPDGYKAGEVDKELLEGFMKTMHDKNMPADVPKEILEWHYGVEQERAAALTEENKKYRAKAETALREKYGKDYTAKTTMVKDFVTKNFDAGVAEAMTINFGYVDAMVDIISNLDPDINVGSSRSGASETIVSRIEALKKRAGTDDAWFKDTAAQNEFKDLIRKAKKMGIEV